MVRIEKDKLAMIGLTSESSFHVYCIYIWDLSTDRIYKIDNMGSVWLWHMDVDDNTLVTFEISWSKQPPRVQQTKWTLTGRLLERKHFSLSLSWTRRRKRQSFDHRVTASATRLVTRRWPG